MRGRSNDIVQGYAYYFGVWEPNLTQWIRRRFDGVTNAVFVDIGANVGYFSLLARSLGSGGVSVVAIEASPSIHDMLVDNIRLNRFDRIRTVNCAAGAGHGTLTLFPGSEDNLGATTSSAWGRNDEGISIEALPLADILTDDEIARVRLIKIDVEGAELDVVEGMRPLLSRLPHDVEMVIEICPTNAREICDTFAEAGFNRYMLVNHYSYKGYLNGAKIEQPVRSRSVPTDNGDFIFSRRDADFL